MAQIRQLGLFPRALGEPVPWVLDLRGQACMDDEGELVGQLYVCRYFADGTSDTPYAADLVRGHCLQSVLGGLRHFCGHLAMLTGWPELQKGGTRATLSTGQS